MSLYQEPYQHHVLKTSLIRSWCQYRGVPRLGAKCEAHCDSCMRGAQRFNLWVPREQPSSTTTKTPAALLLRLTLRQRECPCYGEHTLMHTNTGGPPLHSQPHHGDTTATQYCHGYQGDLCVCEAVGGDGRRRQGATLVILKRPWPFWSCSEHVPTLVQGACVSKTGKALL